MYFGLGELWFVTGLKASETFVPVHEAVDILESDVIQILPAVHALTGCDSTRAITPKKSTLRVAKSIGYKYFHSFGTTELTNLIHLDALIVPQILRQNARRYFSHCSKMFFPVQKDFAIEK